MTTVKHGAPKMGNVSSVMTVMVTHGKMEMPSMENAHTTMGLKTTTTTKQLLKFLPNSLMATMSTANALTISMCVSNATSHLSLIHKVIAFQKLRQIV